MTMDWDDAMVEGAVEEYAKRRDAETWDGLFNRDGPFVVPEGHKLVLYRGDPRNVVSGLTEACCVHVSADTPLCLVVEQL